MSNDYMKNLKDLTVPRPSARAKANALAAAAAAFADGDEETKGDAKGNVVALRQTHMTSNQPSRNNMRLSRPAYAIAASLLVAAISVPVLVYYLRSDTAGIVVTENPAPTGQRPALNKTKKDQMAAKEARALAIAFLEQKLAELDARSTAPKPAKMSKPEYRRDQAVNRMLADKLRQRVEEAKQAPPAVYANQGPSFMMAPGIDADGRLQKHAADRIRTARGRMRLSSKGGAALSHKNAVAFWQSQGLDAVMPGPPAYEGRDKFKNVAPNPIKSVASDPVSTFSVDVDTASYSFVRRALNARRLPQKNAVRVEELINYFSYDYALPETAAAPFRPTVTVLPSPWNPQNKLVHIAIKGYALKSTERPKANLVFLIDVSGSMQGHDRLPLVKNAFAMLLDNLKPDDTVGLVTYASGSGVALKPTKVADKAKIMAAIDRLGAGGSTAGAKGIQDAYALAAGNFSKAAVNRVILATDGDFNVGITNREELKSYIERKRRSGIFLSVLGVGEGNYNDALMQALAQNGNGTAAYIDTLGEARKVLVEEASSTLFPIAKDVKIQIEFNPARISYYRLIGYETRALKRADFNNDHVDAGDVGSGHAVTAIYEVTPAGAQNKVVDDLRYAKPAAEKAAAKPDPNAEFGFLKLRYKLPNEDKSRLITVPILPSLERPDVQSAGIDIRFSTAVAAFGQILRGGTHMGKFGYDDVIALALGAKGADPFGARAEFVNLVRLARSARPRLYRAMRRRR